MTIDRSLRSLALALVTACAERAEPATTPQTAATPGAISDACHLTSQRCSRCHPIDRVLQAHVKDDAWPLYVHRMRLMPASGISAADEPLLVTCLAYLSPTESGIAELAREVGQ
ncbi:MAG TPA: hypothetical protein VGM88_05055 [Kofleriaceae bacterium]|jgi:hypothetical protein